MAAAVTSHDPAALVLPFCMSGGTDAKDFSSIGIACYGFAPGTTPPGFAHWDYVHGVDEHVLVESLDVRRPSARHLLAHTGQTGLAMPFAAAIQRIDEGKIR